MILGWRRHIAASLFRKTLPVVESTTDNIVEVQQPNEDGEEAEEEDDMDKDIEEQLLQLNEQQRKEAKRFVKKMIIKKKIHR